MASGRCRFQELEAPKRLPSRKMKIMMSTWEVAFLKSENNDGHLGGAPLLSNDNCLSEETGHWHL